jgi:extracellular elastinolytic metalloproteinase
MKKNHFLAILIFCFSFLSSAQESKTIISTYMGANLTTLELSITDVTDFNILSEGTLSNKDFKTVYLQQEINGIPVYGTNATVLIKNEQIVKFNHAFISNIRTKISVQNPSLSVKDAAKRAIEVLELSNENNIRIIDFRTKNDIKKEDMATTAMEAPLNYYKTDSGQFVLVYEFVVKEGGSHWWVTKINANTGNLEHKEDAMISCTFGPEQVTDQELSNHSKHSHKFETSSKITNKAKKANFQNLNRSTTTTSILVANEASYLAYPLRIESPAHGERITIVNPAVIPNTPADAAVPSPNGWHDLNEENTNRTEGNNVAAYDDEDDSNGPTSADSFAETTTAGSLVFDYAIDLTDSPDAYRKAAIVNLFVWNNYMHDISYAYGFDETNGAFQEDNYDRFVNNDPSLFSADGDSVEAEAQDGSGLNNANMGTGNDGSNPTMQMFLWGASPFGQFFHVETRTGEPTNPALVRSYDASRFPFFPIPRNDDAENQPQVAQLVVVQDDQTAYLANETTPPGAPSDSTEPTDGCTAYTAASAAAVSGNIALVRRGNCSFVRKITLAQDNGAIGVVLINNIPEDGPVNGGGEEYKPIVIPAISISFEDGEALIAALENEETISGVLRDEGPLTDLVQRDGDVDQGIIAHEYGHGISTRLVGGRNISNCLRTQAFNEQMGEGWSDFFGLVTTQRLTDTEDTVRGIGTYVQFQGNDGAGIRPARYSTDLAVNDFTYADLPEAARGLTVPHGVGFVWSTILWDMYWELINEHGFNPDLYYGTGGNNIALQLVMDGLKLLTCGEAGFVAGRDAILEADRAIYDGENSCLIRAVFARRGVGALASQGTSESRDDQIPNFDLDDGILGSCGRVLTIDDKSKTIFSVYPNPTTDVIYINNNRNTGSAIYNIVDLTGRVIQTNTITLTNGSKINTSSLSTGVYILRLKTNSGEIFSQKIIKK